MIDALCARYHCLPSDALLRATTVDLYILTQVTAYHRRKNNPDSNNPVKRYSTEQLLEILNRNKKQ